MQLTPVSLHKIVVTKVIKKNNKNLAKKNCWFDLETKKVKTFLMDVNCTDEETEDIGVAVVHSLKRLFGDDVDVKMNR